MKGMNPSLKLVQITIQAGSVIPSGAHSRTLRPVRVDFAANPADKTVRLHIDAAGAWTSVEPVTMGPEKALWDNLHGSKVLHTDKYPTIKFNGRYSELSSASAKIEGQLTVKDKTIPLNFTAQGQSAGDSVVYSARVPVKLSQLGIAKFKALLGTLWLEDEATISVAVQAPASLSTNP